MLSNQVREQVADVAGNMSGTSQRNPQCSGIESWQAAMPVTHVAQMMSGTEGVGGACPNLIWRDRRSRPWPHACFESPTLERRSSVVCQMASPIAFSCSQLSLCFVTRLLSFALRRRLNCSRARLIGPLALRSAEL